MKINKIIARLVFVLILLAFCLFLGSCGPGKYCKPENIQNGKSSQHHDTKKFRGMIRVKWIRQEGNICQVKFENMKTSFVRIYENADCKKFKVGVWVNIDSI